MILNGYILFFIEMIEVASLKLAKKEKFDVM